jgi:hypothetical protein
MNAVASAVAAPVLAMAVVVAAKPTTVLDLDTFVEMLEQSRITEQTDLGAVQLFKVAHPEHGNVILVNTAGERHALIYPS